MRPETYDHILEQIKATDSTDPMAVATCGECGFKWDDSKSTELTPTPAGRCPNEYNHPNPYADSKPDIVVWPEYSWTCQRCFATVKGFDLEADAQEDSTHHDCDLGE
jgi:hypothetical protein